MPAALDRGRRRDRPWPDHRPGAAMNRRFDAVVIGAGQAGPPMAGRIAGSARRSPSSRASSSVEPALTPAARRPRPWSPAPTPRISQDGRATSASTAGPVGVDFAAVMARKDTVVGNSRSRLEAWLRGMANCTLIEGQARFVSPAAVRVGDDTIEAERFFINVGCRAVRPDFPGIDQVKIADQHDAARTRRPALAPRHRRRKLYRARVRADLPALRIRGHRGGKSAAPDQPRG